MGGVNQGDGFGWDDLPIWGGATFRASGGVNEEKNEESPGQWRRRGKCLPLRQCICVRANIQKRLICYAKGLDDRVPSSSTYFRLDLVRSDSFRTLHVVM